MPHDERTSLSTHLGSRRRTGLLLSIICPLAFGILMLVLWEGKVFHAILNVKVLQLPVPSRILSVLLENADKVAADALVTFRTATTGLVFGSCAGFLVALCATFSPRWGVGALTVVSAFNAIPVVALSPIMNVWFTNAEVAKAVVVSIVCMVAMAVNAYHGLNNLKPFALDLMKSYAATGKEIFFKLRLPNSIPYIFVGLRINVASAMIGAIVSEYFSPASKGLGFGIRNRLSTGQFPLGWAYIIGAAVIGIILYAIVVVCENCATRHR